MSKKNEDEAVAKQWLERQGLGKLKDGKEPPDFVVGNNKIAIEVTRLSDQLEGTEIPLSQNIEKTLKEFPREPSEPRYPLIIFYPCDEEIIPKTHVVKKQLREFLQYISDLNSSKEAPFPPTMATPIDSNKPDHLLTEKDIRALRYIFSTERDHWALDCGIIITLLGEGEKKGDLKFSYLLNLVSKGHRVGAPYFKHIPRCIEKRGPTNPAKIGKIIGGSVTRIIGYC